MELAIDQIGRGSLPAITLGGHGEASSPADAADAGIAHQACNALLATSNACLAQVAMHARTAINALAVFKGFPDVRHEGFIGQSARALGCCLPGVIAAALNTQDPAHTAEAELALVLSHECVLHPDSLAKYVAAFFKMSRSSLALFKSAFRRDTSALS